MIRTGLVSLRNVSIALLASASCLSFQTWGDPPVAVVEGISEYRLDNGLQVLLFPDPSSSTVTVNVTYLVGSRHEGRGEKGMAHLLEHMVFKGTEKLENIWGALEDHGAQFNGTTWLDRTNYFETLPASDENLEFAIGMEADRMVNSQILPEALAKEMTVVRNEFEMGENNPMGILYQRMLSTAYLWHNYGFSTIGNRSDIERVPAANLKEFYKQYYQPDNAMLVVAGKFDPARTLELIQARFGVIPRPERTLEATWTEEPPQDGARLVTLRRVGDVPAAGLVYHIPPGSHEDFAAVQVLQEILSSQPAGRLYRELVETGAMTNVEGYTFALAEPGVMILLGQVPTGQSPDTALEAMQTLVEGTAANPVTEEDVERIKTRLLKDIKLSLTDSGKIGIELSEWAALGDWRLFFIHRDRIKDVTAEAVNRVAKTYLLESNRTAGIFYPTDAPARAEIPNAPDIASITEGYTGSEQIAMGEVFDATPENIEARTERVTLGEKVKLAMLPKKTRGGAVQLHFRFHFGDEQSLLPRLTECDFIPSMLLRGTTSHSYQELQDKIDGLQSKITVDGAPGLLAVTVETDRDNLAAILEVLEEVLKHPAFDAAEFDIQQNEQVSALEEGLSDPRTLAMIALSRAARPFGKDSVHYVPTQQESLDRVKALTANGLRECYEALYGGSYAEIGAVGDFDSAELQDAIARMLKGWETPKPYVHVPLPYLENLAGPERIDTPDKEMAIVIRTTAFALTDSDPAYPAFDFGVYILGQSAKSRLLNKLRHEGGLSYGAGAFTRISNMDTGALLAGYAICKPDNAAQALEVMRTEMEKWQAEGVDETELADGKESYALQIANDLADDAFVARNLAAQMEVDRTFAHYAALIDSVKTLSLEDVQGALKQVLGGHAYREIVAGDLPE